MRNIRAGKSNEEVMNIIARNYSKLKELCSIRAKGLYCSKSYEDIFQDTVIFVSQDKAAAKMNTDSEVIKHFLYRFKMIEFQAINDDKILKETSYADYKKAPKTYEED